jgi:hypothetical protein
MVVQGGMHRTRRSDEHTMKRVDVRGKLKGKTTWRCREKQMENDVREGCQCQRILCIPSQPIQCILLTHIDLVEDGEQVMDDQLEMVVDGPTSFETGRKGNMTR